MNISLKDLYYQLEKVIETNNATWQKIETIINKIFLYSEENTNNSILKIQSIDELKTLYTYESSNNQQWLAISNIDNRLKLDEKWLQEFRRTLDHNEVSVRVICKINWIKYEQNGLKNREIKTLNNKYLLMSNIDILDTNKIIITTPWKLSLWLVIIDDYIYNIFKQQFYDLWNNNQYILWLETWDDLSTVKWIEIMKSWNNFWIDYVINPTLYPLIFRYLNDWENKLVDFWCWINTMWIQLLYGVPNHIVWLKDIINIEDQRKKINSYIGFEANEKFVDVAIKAMNELESTELTISWMEIVKNNQIPLNTASIDLCLSRNFIVHLNYEDLDFHLLEANRTLKPWGHYIVATLNSDYEQKKYYALTNNVLKDWERYNHYHWTKWELWIWIQFYKSQTNLEKCFNKYFTIIKTEFCMPINDLWKETHPHYYDIKCPMAVIYVLQK